MFEVFGEHINPVSYFSCHVADDFLLSDDVDEAVTVKVAVTLMIRRTIGSQTDLRRGPTFRRRMGPRVPIYLLLKINVTTSSIICSVTDTCPFEPVMQSGVYPSFC